MSDTRTMGTLGPPHGQEPTREEIQSRKLEQARRAGWPQLELEDLAGRRFGILEHVPTGRLYQRCRGELGDGLYTSATAYFLTEGGEVVFVEDPPNGTPQTTAELELEQRRAQKAVPSWRR